MHPVAKAAVVSAVGSTLAAFGLTIFFRGGVTYSPDVNWDKVWAMPYKDATAYLLSKTIDQPMWEGFLRGAHVPAFWMDLGEFAFWLFIFTFACSAIALRWSRH